MTTNLAIKINDSQKGKCIVMASDTQSTCNGVPCDFCAEKIWLPSHTNYIFQIAGHGPLGKTPLMELQESLDLFYGFLPTFSYNLQSKEEIEGAVRKINGLLEDKKYPKISFTFAMQDSLNIFLIGREGWLTDCGERMYSGIGGYEAYSTFYEKKGMGKLLNLREEVFDLSLEDAIEHMSDAIVEVSKNPKFSTGGYVDIAYLTGDKREELRKYKNCF